jgi:hypothetical protein
MDHSIWTCSPHRSIAWSLLRTKRRVVWLVGLRQVGFAAQHLDLHSGKTAAMTQAAEIPMVLDLAREDLGQIFSQH